MTSWVVNNARVLRPGEGVVGTHVRVEDGRIAAIGDARVADAPDVAHTVDGDGALLTPGLIDLHIHGTGRHLFEASPDDLVQGLAGLSAFGVTTALPTLYRAMDRQSLAKLEALGAALQRDTRIRAPGFHLEGPFLALPGAGAATVPGDLALLDDLLAAAGNVAAMSVSPDTPAVIPIIERLVERGIRVFMTHTRASVEETQAAIDAGASHATHFYDVFPLPPAGSPGVRPAGAVEAILADGRVSVDFIADGVHVHPVAIRAALAAKGTRRTLLITDANIGAGLPPGVHATPWGFDVRVAEGDAARIHAPGDARDGALAGSALTMNRGMSNLLRWLELPEHEIWAMATSAPAARMGWSHCGDLRVGMAADLVLWDQAPDGALTAMKTWVAGERVYERDLKTGGKTKP